MSTGAGGQVAISKIGSLYTDVNTVNVWANFKSETLEHKLDELMEGAITGNHDQPPSFKGVDHGAGNLGLEPNPNALSHYLKGWFGTTVHSTVTGATSTGANSAQSAGQAVTYHEFTPRLTAFSNESFLDPYNVMVYRDVGSAWLFKGTVFPTIKLDITAGQLLMTTVDNIMSRKVDRIERIAAIQSLTHPGGRPWVWDMASVEVSTDTTSANLAANTYFEKLSISLETPVEGVLLLDGTKRYAEFQKNGFRTAKFEGTMSFRNQTEYDAFTAYEPRRMRITFLHVSSAMMLGNPASLNAATNLGYYMLRMHFPNLLLTNWSAPISGPNRLTASFQGRGIFDPVVGHMVKAEMINLVSSTTLNAVS